MIIRKKMLEVIEENDRFIAEHPMVTGPVLSLFGIKRQRKERKGHGTDDVAGGEHAKMLEEINGLQERKRSEYGRD